MNNSFFEDLRLIKNDHNQYRAFQSLENTAVIAGPGSGKTRVLALKAVMLAEGYIKKPEGLACISYSRETVREIKKRLKIYGYRPGSKDFVGTVHGFSMLHVIGPFGHLFPQYGIQYPLRIIARDQATAIYQEVITQMRVTEKMVSLIEINRSRSLELKGRSQIVIKSPDLVLQAAKLYEDKIMALGLLDFVSIINTSANMIHDQEFVRSSLHCRFPWLLIDEYQDLGKALHEMVLELVLNAGIKLFAVGDMNQSIYGFNGGYPDFLRELTENDDILPISLSANYRSNEHIILASLEALVPAPPVPVYTAELRQGEPADFAFITCDAEMQQQYSLVAEKIIPKLLGQNISLNEIGILCGSNAEVRNMALNLARNRIPFYISKWDFDNSTVVMWLQDCAKWCLNRSAQSFDEIFLFWQRLVEAHLCTRTSWEKIDLKVELHKILEASKQKDTVESWLSHMFSELGLVDLLEESKSIPDEIENLRLLMEEAKLHNLRAAGLSRFAYLGSPENEVTITTRHSCKGLEFEVVIMLGMEEEKFPNYYTLQDTLLIEEAQRLCYVCVSRAKRSCILVRSKIHTMSTKNGPWVKPYAPSRFWMSLANKFGNQENQYSSNSFF